MKTLLSVIFLLTFLIINAQESILFKQKYLSEKTYKASTKISSNLTMKIGGEKEAIEKLGEAKSQFPMIISSEIEMETTNKTNITEEGKTPFLITYDKLQSKNIINGQETTVPNPFENAQIKGFYTDGSIAHIDEITGFQGNEELKNTVSGMFENLSRNIKFPDYPLKIGEHFNQHIPMTIPIPDLENFTLDTNYTYTLTEIKNDFAYFDLDIQFTINTKLKDKEMNVGGSGNGKIRFDVKNSMMSIMTSNINVEMDFEVTPEIKLHLIVDSQTQYNCRIVE